MKKFLFAFFFSFLAVFSFAQQCKVKPIVKNCMDAMPPYQYDSYAVKEIVYGPKPKKEFIEFEVYSGEEYKLVFGKTVLPQEVGINIYDKRPSSADKKILFFDESGKKDNFVCNFTPTKTGSYYIEYEIPAASAPNQKGCFVVLIGIKE
ncbi:MAG: hypothetical protein HY063_08540 [Bacteroidetes bacterium]|nr:hypothetical protein [Bacteroidota bacterium]